MWQLPLQFLSTLTFVAAAFPNGFRKKATTTTTPRARFEAIAVGSHLALRVKPELANTPSVGLTEPWLDSEEFSEVTGSDGANVIAKLKRRLYFVRDHLLAAA